MNSENSPWYLLGAGSLGCLFAAYLKRAGTSLTVIVREDLTAQTLHRDGITLTRDNTRSTIKVAACTPQHLSKPVERLLICTKAQQTLDAIASIKSKLSRDVVIVLMQNGMGVRERLRHELPSATILHGLSTEGAFRTARFHVTHAGDGETVIGAIDPHQNPTAEKIVRSLHCERSIAAVDDIEYRLWLKLAVNSVINPLTALHRCRNGELLEQENFEAELSQLCEELARVTFAENLNISAMQMRDEVYRVIRVTAQNKSSMLQDIEAGRSSEIDFINGFIVERARVRNLPCTAHARLLQAIRALHP